MGDEAAPGDVSRPAEFRSVPEAVGWGIRAVGEGSFGVLGRWAAGGETRGTIGSGCRAVASGATIEAEGAGASVAGSLSLAVLIV